MASEFFFLKYHWEANIIFYNLFFYCKSKFTWNICISRDSIYHMSKKSSFQRQICPKSVTHIHGITLCLPLNELSCSQIDPRHTSYENIFPWIICIDAPFTPNLGLEHIVYLLRITKTQPSPILRMT